MGTSDRFSPDEVQRILGLTGKQLESWDRLQLVSPHKGPGDPYYDFRDLIGLRTVKQLVEKGISANRLGRAVAALQDKLSHVQAPLCELRVLSDGKDVIVERNGARLEPVSGQFVLNFETRELNERVRVISSRSAEGWIARALECEGQPGGRAKAIDAYENALRVDPASIKALLNCGTLYYEDGNLEKACDCFHRAIAVDPQNALAHFNFGSVLEEVGQDEAARHHLRQAVRFNPGYPDAHYNLAFVCEKLGAFSEACQHWLAYIELDPTGPWCHQARQHLAACKSSKQ